MMVMSAKYEVLYLRTGYYLDRNLDLTWYHQPTLKELNMFFFFFFPAAN